MQCKSLWMNLSAEFCFLVTSGQVECERQTLGKEKHEPKEQTAVSHTHTHRPLKHERVQRKRGIVRAVSGRSGKADSGRKALWVGSEWHRSRCRLCECQGREREREGGDGAQLADSECLRAATWLPSWQDATAYTQLAFLSLCVQRTRNRCSTNCRLQEY